MFTPPSVPGRQVKLQLSCPLARCHVVAPSTETSTALTTPPPASAAVPAIVTADSAAMLAPVDGLVIVETGADTSVLSVAGNIPGCIDPGWVPMSASRLIVACCMATSGVALPESADVSWCVSSPHAHCTDPAPKTSAPLVWRYSVSEWLTVAAAVVDPKSTSRSGTATEVSDNGMTPAGRDPLSRSSSHS